MNGASEVLGGGKAAGLPDPIRLARGAADEAVPYLLDAGLKRALFVADETTARVIGSRLAERYGAAGGAAGGQGDLRGDSF